MLWLSLVEAFSICLDLVFLLRQNLTVSPWLALDSQRAACLCRSMLGLKKCTTPLTSADISSQIKLLEETPDVKQSFSDGPKVRNWGAWSTDVQKMLPPSLLLPPSPPFSASLHPSLEFPEPLETSSRAKLEKHRLLFPLETAMQTQMCFAVAHNKLHLLACLREIINSLFFQMGSSLF